MQVEKKRNFIIKFLYLLIIGLIVFFLAKYVIPLLTPFIAGLVVALMARGIINFLGKYIKINKTLLRIGVLIMMYALVLFLAVEFGGRLFAVLKDFLTSLPFLYAKDIQPVIIKLGISLTERFPNLQEIVNASAQSINSTILSFVEKASTGVINNVTGVAGKVTGLLVKTTFMVISSVLITFDLDAIEGFIKNQMSPRILHVYDNVVNNTGHTLLMFGKAYIIIILVTFTELSIGLTVLGVKNSLLLASLIALVDIFPVLGTGTIMIPWIIYQLIVGNYRMAISLAVIYAVIWVVRQAIEPKIVGDQIGLHPIITLMSIYLGATLFGIFGIFLLPIAITIIKKLNDDKVINLFQ